jgi:hypothetical protein
VCKIRVSGGGDYENVFNFFKVILLKMVFVIDAVWYGSLLKHFGVTCCCYSLSDDTQDSVANTLTPQVKSHHPT